jgi:Sulfotransferase family
MDGPSRGQAPSPGPAVAHTVQPDAADPSADPVFVICAGRSGSTLLRFLLDAHPDLACPPETRFPAMCAQMATVWLQLAGTPPPDAATPKDRGGQPAIPRPAIAGIRQAMNMMVGPYLAQRGKRRYCDKSLGAAEHVPVLREVFSGAKFLCLYRHPMDVIASGIEACPWGLSGFGFDGYAAGSPGNAVKALAQFWADNAAQILAAEEQSGERAYRVRYEDLVADPEAVSDGIFRFLGARPAPGISATCFAPERERLGPGDYKIWHTTRISADSVGRGWAVPAEMMGPALMATVNELAARLGYAQMDKTWGIAAVAPDVRLPGTGPAARAAQGGKGDAPPGLRMMAARLLSGMARLDGQFASLWQPCSREAFLVTVTTPGGGSIAARWRVDLAAAAITSASGLGPGETGGAQWDIIGSADVWKQVLDGGINLSVAFRTRQLRYCDTGDVAAAVPGIRIAMLGDLLGITVWQPAEADGLGAMPLGGVLPSTATRRTGAPAPAAETTPAAQTQPSPAWER